MSDITTIAVCCMGCFGFCFGVVFGWLFVRAFS